MPFDMSRVGKPESEVMRYEWNDAVLYALGIGAKRDELDYLYEGRGPKIFPSFAVVPKLGPLFRILASSGGNLASVLHSKERVRVHKPFSAPMTLHTTARIRGIYDIRKFASMIVDTESRDEHGEMICESESSLLFRGEGGFGGEPPPKEEAVVVVPKGEPPAFRIEEATSEEQAILYRLSGDRNPLHVDPDFAAAVGFGRGPILHGLCTFGIMMRHFIRATCPSKGERVEAFEGQFRRPVWPGDTLVTEGWEVLPNKWALSVKVKERDETVMASACATLSDA